MNEWDYIIVGAGSAGCAVAYELATGRPNCRILILEAGGWDRSLWIKFVAAQTRAIAGHDWGYRSDPDPSRCGTVDRWLRGRVVGGSSSINGTMYVRGADVDFDRWATQSGGQESDWSAEGVFALYRDIESSDQPGPLRGKEGPLYVRTVRRPHPLTEAFMESAVACGHRRNEDYNGLTQEGVAYAQLTQKKGMRWSAADAFLRPILARRNVTIHTDATVEGLELSGGRVEAVRYLYNGNRKIARGGEVVLCAGAINTPKLLMLSGIGEAEELAGHGIPLAVELPGVGRNLKEHPILKIIYRTRVPSYNMTEGMRQKVSVATEFIAHREGIIANLFEATAFLKSSQTEAQPDLQFHFMALGYLEGPEGVIVPAPYPSITMLVNVSRPKSSGRVRLLDANPLSPPKIECQLLREPSDLSTMVEGVGIAREIARAAPLKHLIDLEAYPGPSVRGGIELETYIRKNTGLGFHPAGTCQMGVHPDAVVTPKLQVYGVENLWISDASIMPDLISGNTNACCMMIGAKLGRQLAGRHAGRVRLQSLEARGDSKYSRS